MLKEISLTVKFNDGREDCNKTYLTSGEIEFSKKYGANAIKFIKEGKTRYTHVIIEKLPFWEEFEVVISEATTGRRIKTFH